MTTAEDILRMILSAPKSRWRGPDQYNDQVPGLNMPTAEDSPNAYWDAAHMGNGMGSSIVSGQGEDYYGADPVGLGPRYGGGQDAIVAKVLAELQQMLGRGQ
jgi:hypothetical protein